MSYFRRRGDLVEGILVPFARAADDSYGTYWDAATDFALELFAPQPVLGFHGIGQRRLRREGEFLRFAVEKGAGLWAQARLYSDSALHEHFENLRAAWSSAAVPHLIQVDGDGYVSRWPIFEGSIADKSLVSAAPGLTSADYSRVGIKLPAEANLKRSVWVGDIVAEDKQEKTESGLEQKDAQAPSSDTGASKSEAEESERVIQGVKLVDAGDVNPFMQAAMEAGLRALKNVEIDSEGAGRKLQAGNKADDPILGKGLRAEVGSEWDHYDLLGMAWHHQASKAVGVSRHDAGIDDRYMRAMADKVEKQWVEDQKVPDESLFAVGRKLEVLGLRAIDAPTYRQWHSVMPYLRANESMMSTLVGKGDELVPTLLSSTLYYFMRMRSIVAQTLTTFRMPSNPYDYPKIISGPEFRAGKELSDSDNFSPSDAIVAYSDIGTGSVRFSTGKLEAITLYTRELVEDSGVNFSQAAARAYVDEMAHALDDVLLNGDESKSTTNISYYGASPAGVTNYDRITAFDGIRKNIAAADQVAVVALDDQSILTVMRLMGPRGIFGRDLPRLVCFVPPEVSYNLDALAAYEGMDKVGAMATLLRGQLGSWRGVPVLSSQDFPATDANGRVSMTATDNSAGAFIVLHRDMVRVGMRRAPEIEQARIAGADGSFIRGTMRLDLQFMEAGGAAYAYNITV